MKTNALRELKAFWAAIGQSRETIEFMVIFLEEGYDNNKILVNSPEGHMTIADLQRLDIEYNSGFGGQELFGIIKFKDGTWATRGEYDGSEWWEYNKPPIYEEFLKRNNLS